ncbi:LacI family transcriptional regulator [Aliifodinibius sp. S!AR15-10]|uniref:LacI family DNA-binding transcriptional regulator n=1 Tax=Aliifodinibius sp. S!AR15-10 TaxID=2950437 RepID=UPI00285E74E1|nr:LacI family DNA-binding transcriptional regulator [Aliifodinibius sp. S!AR15-10]MDR8391853.1 LacI family transcriptional regulator [Aliifodinibius sp. S!AR15-10]
MKVTLKDIAEETGFSISTVSRVLNGSDKISPKTKRAIVHTAKKLNYPTYYTQNGNNVLDTLKIFLVVSGFHVGEFYSSFYDGINKAAEENNISLALISINKPLPEMIKQLKSLTQNGLSDGLILFTPELRKEDYLKIKDELPDKFPLMSNGLIESPVLTTVSFDSYSGGYMAAEHFHQKGYQECGILQGPFKKAEARYRANGFRDYILQTSCMDIIWEFNGNFSFEGGAKAFHNFLEFDEKPRAIFSCSDAMCHGFMEEALLKGYQFPDDIAIIGFDDLPICKRHRPTISSIHTDYKQLGNVTMEKMREIVTNPNQQEGVLSLVPVDLVPRKSS